MKKSSVFIIAGIMVFFVRFLPLFIVKSSSFISFKTRFSLDYANRVCGTLVGIAIPSCSWISLLNWLFILVAIGLIVCGIYFIFYKKDKKISFKRAK